MGSKNTAKKSVAKKSVAKKSVVVKAPPTAIQLLQQKLDAAAPAAPAPTPAASKVLKSEGYHWSKELCTRFRACSVPDWVRQQKSLKDAWKKCERTDWMMWMLKALLNERSATGYGYAMSESVRNRLRVDFQFMRDEFGKRWLSRHDGQPSEIGSTHMGASNGRKKWTTAERMQMTDFIRYYFPTPEPQERHLDGYIKLADRKKVVAQKKAATKKK